jgi:hypothetical protein
MTKKAKDLMKDIQVKQAEIKALESQNSQLGQKVYELESILTGAKRFEDKRGSWGVASRSPRGQSKEGHLRLALKLKEAQLAKQKDLGSGKALQNYKRENMLVATLQESHDKQIEEMDQHVRKANQEKFDVKASESGKQKTI